ncbi:MAG: phosphatase PAP2 family protein [Ferruginibacter sp.]
MVFEDKNLRFDEQVFNFLSPFHNESNDKLMNFITFFGSQYFLLPANIVLAAVFLFYKKHRSYSIKIASIAITSTAIMFLLKTILKRQRPNVPLISQAHGYSFPSGHTFTSMVFFGMVAYVVYKSIQNRFLKWLLIIILVCFTFMVGFSRVYLRYHYASDVIAGFCLGIIWLLIAKWLLIKPDKVLESR